MHCIKLTTGGLLACLAFASPHALAQSLVYPVDVARAADGSVFVADLNLPGVWKITDGKPEVFYQASKQFRTPLNRVRCIATDGEGRLLAGDTATREVYRFEAAEPKPLTGGKIGMPMGLAVASDGTIYVSDLETHRVWKISANAEDVAVYAEVASPLGLAIDSQDRLWVVSRGKNQLRRIQADGSVETVVEGQPFKFPHDVYLLDDKTALVSDGYGKCLWKVAEGSPPEKWCFAEVFQNPVGLGGHEQTVYVTDTRATAIFVVDSKAQVTTLVSK